MGNGHLVKTNPNKANLAASPGEGSIKNKTAGATFNTGGFHLCVFSAFLRLLLRFPFTFIIRPDPEFAFLLPASLINFQIFCFPPGFNPSCQIIEPLVPRKSIWNGNVHTTG